MFGYSQEEVAGVQLVRFDGDIGGANEPELKRLFLSLVEQGTPYVVADMSRVTFLDSRVLGTLVWGMKNLRKRGGDLRFFGLHPFLVRLFEITQLDEAFRITETEEAALATYRDA